MNYLETKYQADAPYIKDFLRNHYESLFTLFLSEYLDVESFIVLIDTLLT